MTRDEIDQEMLVNIERINLLVTDANRKIMTGEVHSPEIQTAMLWIAELTNEIDVLREQLQDERGQL